MDIAGEAVDMPGRGADEITLLPRFDLTQRASPKARKNKEINRSICCQTKATILFLSGVMVRVEEIWHKVTINL